MISFYIQSTFILFLTLHFNTSCLRFCCSIIFFCRKIMQWHVFLMRYVPIVGGNRACILVITWFLKRFRWQIELITIFWVVILLTQPIEPVCLILSHLIWMFYTSKFNFRFLVLIWLQINAATTFWIT